MRFYKLLSSTGRLYFSSSRSQINAPIVGTSKTILDLEPVKGTRDFFPASMHFRNWLFQKWRNASISHGFEEYDAPILESETLYTIKSGEEILEQLYNFTDKGDRRLALRPEMTPSLARMVLSAKSDITFPLKWFSIPQCWRYEKTAKGRRREHYQWNVDVWGIGTVEAEAELISVMVSALSSMGVTDRHVYIRINNRKILSVMLESIGIPESAFSKVSGVIDKIDKLSAAQFESLLSSTISELSFSPMDVAEKVQALISLLKVRNVSQLKQQIMALTESNVALRNRVDEGFGEITVLFDLLGKDGYDLLEWIQFDPSIVRGLSYYTGCVFEVFDRDMSLRAVCGGGRYDNLAGNMAAHLESEISEVSIPAVGFGFGDAVIYELLLAKQLLPTLNQSRSQVMIWSGGDNDEVRCLLKKKSLSLANKLRSAGFTGIDVLMRKSADENLKMKQILKKAGKSKVKHIIMCTDVEYGNGNKCVVRNLESATQVECKYDEVVDILMKTPNM